MGLVPDNLGLGAVEAWFQGEARVGNGGRWRACGHPKAAAPRHPATAV